MYGYEPPNPIRAGGCLDTLTIIKVAFQVLIPIVGAGIGALGFVALTFWLFSEHGLWGFVPIALVVVAFLLVARRDKRLQAEKERETRWGE